MYLAQNFQPTHKLPIKSQVMLRNYIKIALRNLWKNKEYTAINIVGLVVAFCIGSFLVLTAYFQLTFDNFHQNGYKLFQSYFITTKDGVVSSSGATSLPLAHAIKAEVPEIELIARVNSGQKSLLSANNRAIERLVTYTDPDFFTMFTFPLASGSPKVALGDIQNLVISKSTAKALFDNENPIGKTIKVGKRESEITFIVSAVAEESPTNSSIAFDAVARIESMPDYQQNKMNWGANSSRLFMMISGKTTTAQVEQKLIAFSKKYYPPQTKNTKNTTEIKLQNISKIHLDKNVSGSKAVPIALIYALIGLAVFILLIACFNFVNLSIAKHFKRAQEMGVRKTLGALKHHLFMQLWGESIIICVVGFVLGFALVIYLLPTFNAYFNAKITLDYLFQFDFVAIVLGVLLVVTLIAGGYPALKMTGLSLVDVLKGKTSKNKPNYLRGTLIVSQFTISSLLICITIIANQQLDFLRAKPLGFDQNQVISIPVGTQLSGRKMLELIRNEFSNNASIIEISGSNLNLGKGKDRVSSRTTVEFDIKNNRVTADWITIDGDFISTMNIPLKEGVSQDKNSIKDAVWISESFKKAIGNGAVLNTFLGDSTNQIVGVFKDFNLYAPSDKIHPVIIQQSKTADISYIFLKVKPESLSHSIEQIKTFWKQNAQGVEFMGSFLDENVESWYQNERMLIQIFSLASSIAIFLSCMGLFAISLLVIELRTKEIGIRKVMGASTSTIVYMLSLYFLKFIFIAFLIALPLAWLAMQNWLETYAYRISLNATPFALVVTSISLITLLTVSYQTIKAALMNPVQSLKSE